MSINAKFRDKLRFVWTDKPFSCLGKWVCITCKTEGRGLYHMFLSFKNQRVWFLESRNMIKGFSLAHEGRRSNVRLYFSEFCSPTECGTCCCINQFGVLLLNKNSWYLHIILLLVTFAYYLDLWADDCDRARLSEYSKCWMSSQTS
jgi:hypothetical protein